MNSQHLAELVELGEAEAYADFFAAAPPDWNCRVQRIGGAVCLFAPDMSAMIFNRVIGLGVREAATEAMLDEPALTQVCARLQNIAVRGKPCPESRSAS